MSANRRAFLNESGNSSGRLFSGGSGKISTFGLQRARISVCVQCCFGGLKFKNLWMSVVTIALLFASVDSLGAANNKKDEPNFEPSVGKPETVRVERGSEVKVTLKGIVFPGNKAEFKLKRLPTHGAFTAVGSNDSSQTYIYRHDGKSTEGDSIVWRIRTGPKNTWTTCETQIVVVEPQPELLVEPEALDFGEVFCGDSSLRTISITNAGGAVLEGRLNIGAPWEVIGDASLSLRSGEKRSIQILYKPQVGGSKKGILEIVTDICGTHRVPLAGVGRFKVVVPDRILFPDKPGEAVELLNIQNLSPEPLKVALEVPEPLICDDEVIEVPPLGSKELRLRLPACRYLAERVKLKVSCKGIEQSILVVLPPPPPILEWTEAPAKDAGTQPPGARIRLEIELRNASAREARVELGLKGAGLALASGGGSLTIPAAQTRRIELVWALPEQIGMAKAAIIADSAGLQETLALSAIVEIPKEPDDPPPAVTGGHPPPSIHPLSEAENIALQRYLPRNIRYRLKQEGRNAAAIVSWELTAGVDGKSVRIERWGAKRSDFFASNPFKKRMQLPGELPAASSNAEWIVIQPDEARLQQTDSGRWEAHVPGLREGYHKVRILVPEPGSKLAHGEEFVILVGTLPSALNRTWFLAVALGLIVLYLLRNQLPKNRG